MCVTQKLPVKRHLCIPALCSVLTGDSWPLVCLLFQNMFLPDLTAVTPGGFRLCTNILLVHILYSNWDKHHCKAAYRLIYSSVSPEQMQTPWKLKAPELQLKGRWSILSLKLFSLFDEDNADERRKVQARERWAAKVEWLMRFHRKSVKSKEKPRTNVWDVKKVKEMMNTDKRHKKQWLDWKHRT